MTENIYIAMLIPDGTNQFFSSLAQSFQSELAQEGYGLIVLNADGKKSREEENLRIATTLDIDGLVVIPVGVNFDVFSHLKEADYPLLVLDRNLPVTNGDFVVVDNQEGVRQGVAHLSTLGHEDVAFVKGPLETQPARERFEAFRESCGMYGITYDRDLVFDGDFGFPSGTEAGQKIIDHDGEPTAVFASNDLMALGILQKFQEEGIDVPGDISILGYDDIAMTQWVNPRLSTILQNRDRIASVGANLLIERIKHSSSSDEPLQSRIETISPEVVQRESTKRL